jgi:predicted adenine nucleotide alpha hydrolase (AANH) superfamily ATPase
MKKQNFKIPVEGETKVLLHACCAPCSSAIVEWMVHNGIVPTIFYSNSNIFPKEEYDVRRNECIRYSKALGLQIVDDEYDHCEWQAIAQGLETEPERGQRCLQCFRFRLERAARYARANGFKVLTTTLASSRWKDLDQVNEAGEYVCSLFPGVVWWNVNWRKGGLQERRNAIIKEYDFYNQQYCGCEFSLAGERLRKESSGSK